MHIVLISLFPEIAESFWATSLIAKAIDKGLISYESVNPRDFCHDKHKQVDDEIYGGGSGLLIKAKPVIDAVESVMIRYPDAMIVYPSPSQIVFTQQHAYDLSTHQTLIFVCGRYEGIDQRRHDIIAERYPGQLISLSLGSFIVMGGEIPSLCMIEAITRLIPGVLHDANSFVDESYRLDDEMQTLEYPQYTRPEELYGHRIPEILLSGHHAQIQQRRESQRQKI